MLVLLCGRFVDSKKNLENHQPCSSLLLSSPLFSSPVLKAKDSSLLRLSLPFPSSLPPPPPHCKVDKGMERRGKEAILRCVPRQLKAEFQPRMAAPSRGSLLVPPRCLEGKGGGGEGEGGGLEGSEQLEWDSACSSGLK